MINETNQQKQTNKMTKIIDEYGIDFLITDDYNNKLIMKKHLKNMQNANIMGVIIPGENSIKIVKCRYSPALDHFYHVSLKDYPEYIL